MASRRPARLLWWLAMQSRQSILLAMVFGSIQLVGLVLVPVVVGEAIDTIASRRFDELLRWVVALLALSVVISASTLALLRAGDRAWLRTAALIQRTVIRHVTGLGAALPKKVKVGEVVALGTADLYSFASLMEVIGRMTGSLVAFGVVAALSIAWSPILGAVVLIGVPIATIGFLPLVRPLQQRMETHRDRVGETTAVAADIVSGLRILRGIGGERQFFHRFSSASQQVRSAGVAAGRIDAGLTGLSVLLPGLVVVAVTWLGARLVLNGTITIGELVAFYGLSAFLSVPVQIAANAIHSVNSALVAARRACTILNLAPELTSSVTPVPLPPGPFGLSDLTSGLMFPAGELTVVTGSAEMADRLGRYVDAPVLAGDVALSDADLAEVRRRILVAHNLDTLFSGSLRGQIDMGRSVELSAALRAADVMDVIEGLDDGIDEELVERGRNLSGGQRQRLMLARALSFDADVLVLDQPSSAVDAHTEARIVERVADLRRGQTTIVFSDSPLWQRVADKVCHQ